MDFLRKNKKNIILALVGIGLILIGFLSWNFYFSKYDIFAKQEKLFLEAVERYYEFNTNQLPKKNETRETTLQDLYDGNHIEALYIPKTKELCDTNSWVRVYQNDEGLFEYTVYLKCGKFESDVDHEGPEITLNGDETIVIALDSEYKELGVNKVIDKVEGTINTEAVVIDSSNVNTSKIGTYKVTYTVRDKAYNKTVVTRNIIVARNLTEVVKKDTDDSNLYKGLNPNNYLQFSGMLWRIVGLDSEGNVKIVTQNSIANVNYGKQGANFKDSNIKDWLNNYFYKKIYNTDYLVKDNLWCIDNVMNTSSITDSCTTTDVSTVGLLSLLDFQSSKNNSQTYLSSTLEYWFINRKDDRFGYIHTIYGKNLIDTYDNTSISGVKPMIILKKDLYINSGNGTFDSPYSLGDYTQGKENDLLNTRIIGEYASYFGMLFRISDIDQDGNIKLISTNYLQNNTTSEMLFASYNNEDGEMKFNTSQDGNIGYILNNSYIDYIDTSLIITHEFEIPNYNANQKYSDIEISKFKTKVAIPASYEMFAGINSAIKVSINYWLLDYIDGNSAFIINNSNGRAFKVDNNSLYNSNGFKLVFYVDKTTKIKSGKGTFDNPYVIK